MKRRLAVATASIALLTPLSAFADALPAIKTAGTNKVPECATPGRLMAYLGQRNAKLDPRFESVATAYMRHGEQLGIRWDYAFFQMILETGSLAYKRGDGKPGDVKPSQNNFAGIGATGKGEPGDRFATVDDGVRAHLQHLQMYAGERVESPIADRTRKVQDWGVLTSWHKGFKRPITFSDLAAKWAPGSRGYAGNVRSIGETFYEAHCNKPDPKPELVAEARSGRTTAKAVATAARTAGNEPKPTTERSPGAELARQALERARAEGDDRRSALGGRVAGQARAVTVVESAPVSNVTVLNEARAEEAPVAETPARKAPVQTASAAAAAKPPLTKAQPSTEATVTPAAAGPMAKAPPVAQPGKCRVFTASYGGQRAVIIRSLADQFVNFTVLDVNEGQESREIEAYVAAYAKGGQAVGEFSTSTAALDKAFQLCPEG